MNNFNKNYALAGAILLILVVALEIFSFLTGLVLHDDLFSREREFLRSLDPAKLTATLNSPAYSPALGWDLPADYVRISPDDCSGRKIAIESSKNRSRTTVGVAGSSAKVAIFGDSYAHGDEVNDGQTIESILTQKYHIPTLNFGVTAFGPVQATLKFEQQLPEFTFDTAVLMIMHEDIRRMVNGFRPILVPNTENKFSFKPYIRDGVFHQKVPLTTWDQAIADIKASFKNDFWATPEFRFPYSVSLVHALSTPNFKARLSNKLFGVYSYEYSAASPLRRDLRTVIERFVGTAKTTGIQPLIVFVPLNRSTHLVASDFADWMNGNLGEPLVVDLDMTGIDWQRYNIKPGKCHPSAYGYEMLAERLAPYLR